MRFDIKKIDRARILAGYSKSTIARKIGKSIPAVCNTFNGIHQGVETIKAMADLLGLDMEELLIEDDERADIPA